jgi:hypothetical protein
MSPWIYIIMQKKIKTYKLVVLVPYILDKFRSPFASGHDLESFGGHHSFLALVFIIPGKHQDIAFIRP